MWRVITLISPECHIYTSVNWVRLGSGNGLLPIRHQAITWTNADTVNWTPRNKLWNQNTKFFINENAIEHVVCKRAAILSGGDDLKIMCYINVLTTYIFTVKLTSRYKIRWNFNQNVGKFFEVNKFEKSSAIDGHLGSGFNGTNF